MKEIISIITLPVLTGLLLFFVPEKFRTFKGLVALLVSIITGYLTIIIYSSGNGLLRFNELFTGSGMSVPGVDLLHDAGRYLTFNNDNLSKLIILCVSLFTFLILSFSIVYIKAGRVRNYYPYFLITLGCAYGALLSDNLLLFLAFWGALGITLYKLIHGYDEESSATAKKTLILIGASDSVMIVGIAIIWKITGSLSMDSISVPTSAVRVCAKETIIPCQPQGVLKYLYRWIPALSMCNGGKSDEVGAMYSMYLKKNN